MEIKKDPKNAVPDVKQETAKNPAGTGATYTNPNLSDGAMSFSPATSEHRKGFRNTASLDDETRITTIEDFAHRCEGPGAIPAIKTRANIPTDFASRYTSNVVT